VPRLSRSYSRECCVDFARKRHPISGAIEVQGEGATSVIDPIALHASGSVSRAVLDLFNSLGY
jgi:hypothetical protein